jgi:hypothetical protein
MYTRTLNFSASVVLDVDTSSTPNPRLTYGSLCRCEGVKTWPLLCILHWKKRGSNFKPPPSVSINPEAGQPWYSAMYSRTLTLSRFDPSINRFKSSSLCMSGHRFFLASWVISRAETTSLVQQVVVQVLKIAPSCSNKLAYVFEVWSTWESPVPQGCGR